MSQAAFQPDAGHNTGEGIMLPTHPLAPGGVNASFYQSLLDNLTQGVVFLDQNCRITSWNVGMEQLTGLGNSVLGRKFSPNLLQLRDMQGELLNDLQCPFQHWLQTRASNCNQYVLTGRSGREIQIELSFHPVTNNTGELLGATVIVLDTSAQQELQKQLNDLYAIAVLDPLTQVANRAEFERLLDEYVRTHLAIGLKCSIIIADLDFFKQINDNFGHHVGDQALIAFAQHLKQFIRSHDFVARYGGEEFVVLCANCDENSAVQRAEEIRSILASSPQASLSGKCITASFGVSELIPDDTATGLFVRADRALLKAKELGRNRVVAANSMTATQTEQEQATSGPAAASGIQWRPLPIEPLLCEEYWSPTPLIVMLEKVRGFIEETGAEIVRIEDGFAALRIQVPDPQRPSRKLSFLFELDLVAAEQAPDKCRSDYAKSSFFLRVSLFQELTRWSRELREEAAHRLLISFLGLTMLANPEFHIKRLEMATENKARY
jgi:diguanylate cyclase (GGDEF)-like protein/PAS domain S-box-containing protein